MTRKAPVRRIALFAVLAVLVLVPSALAARGGGGGHKSGTTTGGSYTGTLTGPVMVVDVNSNGQANYGDQITFNVTSTAPYPFVRVDCSQNGTPVWSTTQGFYSGWLWGTNFNLVGAMWKGGAADCTATLYSQSSSGTIEPTEKTLGFSVAA